MFTVSDEELDNYGKDQTNEVDFDEDMLAYRADTMGISLDELKKQLGIQEKV
jgi:hypothetical protein